MVSDRFDRVIIDEFAFTNIFANRRVDISLLLEGVGIPQVETVAFIPFDDAVLIQQFPKKIKRTHKKLYIMVYYADSYI